MDNDRIRTVFKTAKNLLSDPEHWIKGMLWADEYKNAVVSAGDAKCYCLSGAIIAAAAGDAKLANDAMTVVERVLGQGAPSFNDHSYTVHADVLAMLDVARESVRYENQPEGTT